YEIQQRRRYAERGDDQRYPFERFETRAKHDAQRHPPCSDVGKRVQEQHQLSAVGHGCRSLLWTESFIMMNCRRSSVHREDNPGMRSAFLVLILLPISSTALIAQPADDGWEVIYDAQTKIRLKDAHFTAGTRHPAWLARADNTAKAKAKAPAGPEYLEFREDKTPMYTDDIVTYIPVASVQRIDYEHEKKLVRVTVKQTDDSSLTLAGPTKYANINKFSLEGMALAKNDVKVEG